MAGWHGLEAAPPPPRRTEITSERELQEVLGTGGDLRGRRIQGLDLRPVEPLLRAGRDLTGLVVLGGIVPHGLAVHLQESGALVFPTDTSAPVDPYRARLYRPEELYVGLSSGGYDVTPDARAYHWYRDARLAHDVHVTMLRAIHDDSMSDALDEVLDGARVVGVMGGHALRRGTTEYAAAARLGHELASEGLVVLTGGGPGAMEAANLGAWIRDPADLAGSLRTLATVPDFGADPTAWAATALEVRSRLRPRYFPVVDDQARVRSLGIPTWFYGHEPPNVFCDGIAKYFSNALREEGLISRCSAGIVVLPGAAGTVQEVFQAVTPMFYADSGAAIPPLVLVGRDHWIRTIPVWKTLESLARGRSMAAQVRLVDDVTQVRAELAR
ncbi:MAG: LOG family protein [Tetrasphaera sp.]|nr:LOG family protein [Tetrasphaera sp.]